MNIFGLAFILYVLKWSDGRGFWKNVTHGIGKEKTTEKEKEKGKNVSLAKGKKEGKE